MRRGRLPRRTKLGPYTVETVLVTQATLRGLMEDEDGGVYEGCWVPSLDEVLAGRIFIDQKLTLVKKWAVFYHELMHAVNDIRDWDLAKEERG